MERKRVQPAVPGRVTRALAFFQRLESCFSAPEDISGPSLLEQFTVPELRAYNLAARYLAARRNIRIRARDKTAASERARIDDLLRDAKRQPWLPLLMEYHESLAARKISTRTHRMYLATAIAIARHARLGPGRQLTQADLTAFLRRHKGARTNLFPWVAFGRTHAGWTASMQGRMRTLPATPRTVRLLAQHLQAITARGVHRATQLQLQRVIATALGFPMADLDDSRWIVTDGDKAVLRDASDSYDLSEELLPLAQRWQALRRMRLSVTAHPTSNPCSVPPLT